MDGYPTPNITWFKNDRLIVQTHRIQIPDHHRLVIYGATKDDSGDYKCEAINEYSSAFHAEQIAVEGRNERSFEIDVKCLILDLFEEV